MSFKDDTYYTVFGWMINRLGLSGNELIVYANIYSFSQDGKSCYYGGIDYLAKASNSSKNTVLRVLTSLVKTGKIIKQAKVFRFLLDIFLSDKTRPKGRVLERLLYLSY